MAAKNQHNEIDRDNKEESLSHSRSQSVTAQHNETTGRPKLINNYSGSRDRATSNTPLKQYDELQNFKNHRGLTSSIDGKEESTEDEPKKIRQTFETISHSFMKKYDELYKKYEQLIRNNKELEKIKHQKDEEIKRLNEKIKALQSKLTKDSPSDHVKDLNNIHENKTNEENKDNEQNEDNESQNVENIKTKSTIQRQSTLNLDESLVEDILNDINDLEVKIPEEYEMDEDDDSVMNLPEKTPTIQENDSSMHISVNDEDGTPVPPTTSPKSVKSPGGLSLTQRQSVLDLHGTGNVKKLTQRYASPNPSQKRLSDLQLVSPSPKYSSHALQGSKRRLHHQNKQNSVSYSRSTSFKKATVKAKHKHKRKPRGGRKHKSVNLDSDDEDDMIATPKAVSSSKANNTNNRSRKNIYAPPSVKRMGSRKDALGNTKKYKSNHGKQRVKRPALSTINDNAVIDNTDINKELQKKPITNSKPKGLGDSKSRAAPMLNSKERKPSILHLLKSGKNKKNKSKK